MEPFPLAFPGTPDPAPHDAVAGAATLEPYFLGLGRAMISLGPLANRVYCTYKCKFCYVNGPYQKYARRNIDEIVDWLKSRRAEYDIVYLSGDTDSFAPPRTQLALTLIDTLADLDVDVLFTTRYVFSSEERLAVRAALDKYRDLGRLLVPCISISQLEHPELEPYPIPSPSQRLDQMRWLHEVGASALLTVRPFIPYIDAEEYAEIVRLGAPYSAAILGGDWYTDEDGVIDAMTRQALGVPRNATVGDVVSRGPLDSTHDSTPWLITRHPSAEILAADAARHASKPFFMRSGAAIKFLRSSIE